MKIEKIYPDKTYGTSLQGRINVSYRKLRKLFGKPDFNPDHKVQIQFNLKIGGVICTIYDYKNDNHFLKIQDWHVGGYSPKSLDIVAKLTNGKITHRGIFPVN